MDAKIKENKILKINEALQQLRPYLQADGGDVSFIELTDNNIVKVELTGACKTCSMSIMTLKAGIEEAVKRVVPEIQYVEAVQLDHELDPA